METGDTFDCPEGCGSTVELEDWADDAEENGGACIGYRAACPDEDCPYYGFW